jgi:hypothetical protein
MIKKQVIDYLLSKSGNLDSRETWYDVGIKFGIEPQNKERASTDEAYRKRSIQTQANDIWRGYIKQINKLAVVKQTYKDGELKFETFKEKPEDVKINHEDFDIEKFTTNPYGGAWIKLKRKEKMFEQEHLDTLKEILTKELSPVYIRTPEVINDKALFIYGSDKHIGALTKEDSIYTNKYDREEMRQRIVIQTLNQIQHNVALYGQFDSLFIMDLGDALDGFNGKTTGGLRGTSSHTLPQQLNNREQHDYYLELHKELFDTIAVNLFAKNIYFVATSNSNHGGDFEYGAMRNLETYLNVKYPDIKTYVSYKPYNHFIYGKHCIIFGHGKDDEDMKNGLPLVLNDKVSNVLNDYITVNKLNMYNISFISGDLHQSAETYAKNFRYKKVLSQYGSSKWMHTNFGSGNPGLSLEIFLKNDKVIHKQDVFFNIENESNTGITF